jgi:hypothetical protein
MELERKEIDFCHGWERWMKIGRLGYDNDLAFLMLGGDANSSNECIRSREVVDTNRMLSQQRGG